jgi:hypothetical protein
MSVPLEALRLCHDDVSMPGSESLVAFSVRPADEVTFHEGKGVKGFASVVVKMAAVKTASHRAFGDRIVSNSFQNKKMKKKKQQSNKSSYGHARYTPIRLAPVIMPRTDAV